MFLTCLVHCDKAQSHTVSSAVITQSRSLQTKDMKLTLTQHLFADTSEQREACFLFPICH